MPTLLVFDASPDPFWRAPENFVQALKSVLPSRTDEPWILQHCHRGKDLTTALRDADAYVGWAFPPALARKAQKLRMLHFLSAGVPAGWTPFAEKHPQVQITRSSGINAESVAEHALFLMMALLRGISPSVLSAWDPNVVPVARSPGKMRCGIVGAGPVGVELLRLLKPLFGDVRIMSRSARQAATAISEGGHEIELGNVCSFEDAAAFFATCDALVLALPATLETAALFAGKMFGALRSDALIVNMGRGESLDEEQLVDFLDTNPRARFAADVARAEPYPANGLLYAHPRVILTPHIGGRREGVWERLLPRALDALKTGLRDHE